MTVWTNFKQSLRCLLGDEDELFITQHEGQSITERDTLAAIRALNQEVRNDPNGVETYLALGNLYRSRGDLERAIQIRNGLIVRPALENSLKARIFFELGLDYKRGGFIDRAFKAFEQALDYGGPEEVIRQEIAMLYADSGNFPMAVKAYAKLGHKIAEAYYLTRISEDNFAAQNYDQAMVFAKRAIRANAEAVEGWLQRIKIAAQKNHTKDIQKSLHHAFMNVKPELQFMLLEGLWNYLDQPNQAEPGLHSQASLPAQTGHATHTDQASQTEQTSQPGPAGQTHQASALPENSWRTLFSELAAAAIANDTSDALLNYYKGLFLLRAGKALEASTYFEKSIIAEPDFWAAHLEVLGISFRHQNTSPMFSEQIQYLLAEGRKAKRFVCSRCAFKRDALFFVCPRCRSWHSALFRRSLKD